MAILNPGRVSLETLKHVHQNTHKISINDAAWGDIKSAQAVIESCLEQGQTVYGINTGFGLLANTAIESNQLKILQKNLVRSHCAGIGERLEDAVVRLILVLKINSLAQGYSGVRPVVIQHLLALYHAQYLPFIHSKGSVGASGDLAPLADLASVLIGEGTVIHQDEQIPAAQALKNIGLQPLSLAPKEGLALLNGTQVSCALALHGLFQAQKLYDIALQAGALSLEAFKGSHAPFDARIHEIRKQPGQISAAKAILDLVQNSEIHSSHQTCLRVQDPYSFRCIPQVMGACKDQIDHAAEVLSREANAVTDNPLIFAKEGHILSGGNFHAEPVAFAADNLALAIAEIGSLSERRISILVDPNMSNLPAFLTPNSGINSGFMIAQVTAAALASENKSKAHPGSVDTIPTSANQEDHVSMATYAARRLSSMCFNTGNILAIELLSAAQGIEFHRPLKTSEALEKLHAEIRKHVPAYEEDRVFSDEIQLIYAKIIA